MAGTAELDFYLRLYWRDNRMNMPLFWEKVSPQLRKDGFYLTSIMTRDPAIFWTPDVRFHDIVTFDVLAQVSLFV